MYVAVHFQTSQVYGSQKKVSKRLSLSVRTCTLGVFKLQYKSGKDKSLQHFYTWECCLLRINIVIYTAALQTFDFVVLAPRAVWNRYTGMLRCDQILYVFTPKLLIYLHNTQTLSCNSDYFAEHQYQIMQKDSEYNVRFFVCAEKLMWMIILCSQRRSAQGLVLLLTK